MQRLPLSMCAICLGLGLLGVLGALVPVLSIAEDHLGLHLLYRLRGAEKPQADVVIVAIDRESAKAFNLPAAPQKWPRKLHARLIDRLRTEQAAVVAFDLIFHEPQQSSDDEVFAAAIRQAGNVILTQPIDRESMPLFDHNNMPTSRVTIEKMVSAIPILADAAICQAPFPLPKVPVKLNQYWRFSPGSGDLPTLPVMVMHLFALEAFNKFITLLEKVDPAAASTLWVDADDKTGVRHVIEKIRPIYLLFKKDAKLAGRMMAALETRILGPYTSNTVRQVKAFIGLYGSGSSSYLNFYGPPKTVETISYHRLLGAVDPDINPSENALPSLNGKAVFVGQTESDWFKANDGFHTAFTEDTGMDISGVEVAATAFANLMEEKVVHPFKRLSYYSILLGWGFLSGLVAMHFSALVSAAGLISLSSLYLGLAHLQFKTSGIWYPLVIPLLVQAPAAYIAGLAWKYRNANIERRNIREAFGYYLPDEVVNRLAANAKALRGGGRVLYSICLFTDAESYTTLSESLDPASLTHLMNRYYEAIFKPIKDNNGVVLQVVGDSVLAIWTAPQPKNNLKVSACKAAIGISKSIERFNAMVGDHALPTRIGLHAGEVLLGNIGAIDHFEYRPVGDIVNTASRLEGLNKYLGTRVLASQEVLGTQNGNLTRPVGRFVFKGKSKPVHVNELIFGRQIPSALKVAVCKSFASGLQAFEQRRWEEADAFFSQTLKMDRLDGPSKFYLALCRQYRKAPPAKDWNGVVHLSEK